MRMDASVGKCGASRVVAKAYDAEERGAADAALGSSPKGRGVSGGLLCREPREGGRPFASARFAHPIPKRLRRNREYLCRGSLVSERFRATKNKAPAGRPVGPCQSRPDGQEVTRPLSADR